MRNLAAMLVTVLCGAALVWAEDWPQWRGAARDGVWREEGIVDRFGAEALAVRWRAAVGPGFSGISVSGGRVLVMDRVVEAGAASEVRTRWDFRDKTAGEERILCLDEKTGKALWSHAWPVLYSVSYGQGPRATPTACGDKVYALGAMGDLICLDVQNGKVMWTKSLVRDFDTPVPLYGFASSPLADGERLYVVVGAKDAALIALDRHTGKEVWKSGSASHPGYCSPIIATLAGKRQIVVWNGDGLGGFDAESGKALWRVEHRTKEGLAISTPAIEGDRLVVSSQYEGAMMLQFKAGAAGPEVVWKASTGAVPEKEFKKAGLNTTLSPVLLMGNHVYGVSLYGETACLDGDTGARKWTTLEPSSGGAVPRERWSTFFAVRYRDTDRAFLFNEKGDLILARLSPKGYEEIGRTHLLDPDMASMGNGRKVIWAHPAFANRCIFVRNNREVICVPLGVGGR